MGGEWSKAVGMIFKQKYSNGRGKLQDAMKDPETKVLHEQLKSGKKVKVGKTRKMRGGAETVVEEDHQNDEGAQLTDNLEERVTVIVEKILKEKNLMAGGFPAKSKKSRKVKSRRN